MRVIIINTYIWSIERKIPSSLLLKSGPPKSATLEGLLPASHDSNINYGRSVTISVLEASLTDWISNSDCLRQEWDNHDNQ